MKTKLGRMTGAAVVVALAAVGAAWAQNPEDRERCGTTGAAPTGRPRGRGAGSRA